MCETSLKNRDKQMQLPLFSWATVNFQFQYFPNEETEGVLPDALMNFQDWHLTSLFQLKPYLNVLQTL